MKIKGISVISEALKTMPTCAGVYSMLGEADKYLYIGKAKNLKKRLQSYTKPERQSVRIQRMLTAVQKLEIITTHTEAEALLLEANLIKKLKPFYNILLRDDKSYPMILIRQNHQFAQVVKHRGNQKIKGNYFGPFANAQAVNQTITILQKAFLLRNCSDNVFANRSRPCLQYHIKRCCAPCVGKVSHDEYAELVDQARLFLSGKSRTIQEKLSLAMQQAGEQLQFEKAALLRDRIKALNSVQSRQDINLGNLQDADIIALAVRDNVCCVQVFFYRGGRNYGNRLYFPSHISGESEAQIVSAFIAQFYSDKLPPKLILCSVMPTQVSWLVEALSCLADRRVSVSSPVRGERKQAVDFAVANVNNALSIKLSDSLQHRKLLAALGELLGMGCSPEVIEVYDNSHLQGSNSVGAMIVVGIDGFVKKRYRKFNIRSTDIGDDYAMMREVMLRRFRRAGGKGWELPDLVVLDGGKGQLSVAVGVLEELGMSDSVELVAVSKGIDRHAGREVIHLRGGGEIALSRDDVLQFFIQRIRDEAHRFVIGVHRDKRSVDSLKSQLDEIPEVGRLRRRRLLLHFGSMSGVANAGIEDLCGVSGISRRIAEKIYGFFHS